MSGVLLINFLVSIPLIVGQQPGVCPYITGIRLDPNKMVGLWYQNSRDSSSYDKALKCQRVFWNPPNGLNFTLLSEGISTITNKKSSSVAEGSANSHILKYHVPVLGEVDFIYYVLGVNYDRWRVLWHCENHGNTHTEAFRVYTREQFPNERKLEQFVDQSFKNWGLQKPQNTRIDQNC